MSGIHLTPVDSIIDKIKASQQKVLKAFEEHNVFVNESLEKLQQLKTETKIEVVKVKDPLEEIKRFKDEVGTGEYYSKPAILAILTDILWLYGSDKISTSFKEIFLKLFELSLETNEKDMVDYGLNINEVKKRFLKVRDIRWLLLEMEKYPQFFPFTEDDLRLMKEHDASRDNICIVKKFLKKDIDYTDLESKTCA